MIIWLLILLLVGLFALIGYAKGAIRMLVSWLGLVLGLVLAYPLSPLVKPLMPKMKIENPVWIELASPVFVFLLFAIVFIGVSFYVHHVLQLKIKFRRDEEGFLRWKRLNRRVGLCLGVATGATYALVIGLFIYVVGHLSYQVASEGSDPSWLGLINKAKADLHSTGFAKTVSVFDSTPQTFYEVSDLLALLYHNPKIYPRLELYPAFLSLAQKPDIAALMADDSFQKLFSGKSDLATIINHGKTQAILNNPSLVDELLEIDRQDLSAYLETAVSEQYQDEKILGKWKVDPSDVMQQVKRTNPNISVEELVFHKKLATTILAGINLTATPDNQLMVEIIPTPEMQQRMERERRRAEAIAREARSAQVDVSQFDQQTAQRYGLNRNGDPNSMQQAPVPQPEQKAEFQFSGKGSWKKLEEESRLGAEKYEIRLKDDQGPSLTIESMIRSGKLLLYTQGLTLVLNKIQY